MAEQMKKIECPAPCTLSVKSHDEKEIVEMTMQHAKKNPQHDHHGAGRKKDDQAGLRTQADAFAQNVETSTASPADLPARHPIELQKAPAHGASY